MNPSPAIILGERIQPLDELANIALSSSLSSPSSYTPQKRKLLSTNKPKGNTVKRPPPTKEMYYFLNH